VNLSKDKRKDVFLVCAGIVTLIFVFSMLRISYAGPSPVYKRPSPKKELKNIDGKVGLTGDSTKIEEKEAYVYSPVGKTDPFEPFINKNKKGLKNIKLSDLRGKSAKWLAKMEAVLKKLREPKTELQRIKISKLTLTAIIKGKGKIWAMVSDSKGKGYMLKKGTYIGTNGGVVDKLVCEEQKTHFGIKSERKVIIKEPYLSSENKIENKIVEMKMD